MIHNGALVTVRFRGGVRGRTSVLSKYTWLQPADRGGVRGRSSDQSGMSSLMNIDESSPTIKSTIKR